MTSQPDNTSSVPRKLSVRRAPKYVPFLVAGGLAGIATAAVFAFGFSSAAASSEDFDASSVFGLFAVLLVLPGMGLGAIAALLLDRQGRRHAKTLLVESLPDDEGNAEAERA
ncbi:hypothetical protein [Arthrobacter sp. HY1533]|uniref:hypothetical protein n=1 Tax=Arthrobacter sp. HY1533 TaxID=2970919 RepID=UPI0022B9FADE|nr:hypothetical protein [Arthrobacter sp. HY1533]